MASSYNETNASLGEIIEHLKKLPPDAVVAEGFGGPGSYRGYYGDVAFAPEKSVTVASMLKHAEKAVGATFYGYKGGEFRMLESTPCWLADYGDVGPAILVPGNYDKHYFLPTAAELEHRPMG